MVFKVLDSFAFPGWEGTGCCLLRAFNSPSPPSHLISLPNLTNKKGLIMITLECGYDTIFIGDSGGGGGLEKALANLWSRQRI